MRVQEAVELIRSPHGRRWLWRTARQRLYSRRVAIGIRRDLSVPYDVPPAKIPLIVRPLRPDDDLSFIAAAPGLSVQEAQRRADQRWFLRAELPNCWVAVDPDGQICFMAWLLTARDNDFIRARWRGLFPDLHPDEGMVEGVHTAETHRGLGIMGDATNQMMQQARDLGIKYSLGYIVQENSASLRGGEKHGATPFARREERWLLFRHRIRFTPIENAAN